MITPQKLNEFGFQKMASQLEAFRVSFGKQDHFGYLNVSFPGVSSFLRVDVDVLMLVLVCWAYLLSELQMWP